MSEVALWLNANAMEALYQVPTRGVSANPFHFLDYSATESGVEVPLVRDRERYMCSARITIAVSVGCALSRDSEGEW